MLHRQMHGLASLQGNLLVIDLPGLSSRCRITFWFGGAPMYPGRLFDRYAVLGDDIVIADTEVAEVYRKTLARLCVKISESQSLISHTGCAEFAKRFLVKGGLEKDLSPVTIKAVLGAHLPKNGFALAHRYPLKRFSTFRRLGGAGYKSCSRIPGPKSTDREKVDWCLWVQLHFPSLSLEYYFGEGKPLSPYAFWWVYRRLVRAYALSDLRVPPDNIFVTVEQQTFLEYTSMRGWVEEWLDYYLWWLRHYQTANCCLDYGNATVKSWIDLITLDEVFDSPLVRNDWRLSNIEIVRVRYSLLQRIKRELDALPPFLVLPEGRSYPDEGSAYISSEKDWCKCVSKSDMITGKGDQAFLVNIEGLIIPPCSQCSICRVRKSRTVYIGR